MGGRKAPDAVRREQLLAAAYEVALAGGLDAVTARSVAAAAGTSHGLVFFHFGSVNNLLLALLDELLAAALDLTTHAHLADLPPEQRLRELVRCELLTIRDQLGATELLLAFWLRRDAECQRRIDDALERYRDGFASVCEAAVPDPAQASTLATVLVAFIQGASVQAVRNPQSFDPEGFLDALSGLQPAVRAALG